MEALQNYVYSNEELCKLYKSSKEEYYISMLYQNNYKIIWKLCNKYKNVNWMYSIDDLLSEAFLGLEKAVEYFVDGSCSFFSFLCVVLNQYLYGVVNGFSSKDRGNKLLNQCVSVYEALTDDEDPVLLIDQLEDSVAQEEIDKLPEVLFMADLHAIEEKALNKLTNKQKTVVEGINGFNSAVYSVNELSELLNVSYPRITELRNNSYLKLKQDPNLRKIWETEFKYR